MLKPTPDFEWHQYFDAAEKGTLHRLYERLEPHVAPGHTALDLGCGVGAGTIYLSSLGLQVTAVDIFQDALDRLQRRMPEGISPSLIRADFAQLNFDPQAFDVVAAVNCLYFLPPDQFESFWPRLVAWIKPGGLFTGTFMGPNDSWAEREDYSRETEDSVRLRFQAFEILDIETVDAASISVTGTSSHTNTFHVLARRV